MYGQTLVGASMPTITAKAATASSFRPGDILICPALSLDHYQAVIVSAGVLCSAGGLTGHLPSICRIRGIPVVIFDPADLAALTTGAPVTVDPASGTAVVAGAGARRHRIDALARPASVGQAPIEAVIAMRADIDAVNHCSAAALVDSFFIREEFLWTALAADPARSLPPASATGASALLKAEIDSLLAVLAGAQRLTFRLLDLRSDEAEVLALDVPGRVDEPNPELGLHGSRRIAQDARYQEMTRTLTAGLQAASITWSIPFINDEVELDQILGKLGVSDASNWGVFVETPAAVYRLPSMLDRGVSVVNVGTKDLVQFVLAADRNNHAVAHVYDTRHPAVMTALSTIVSHCATYDVTLRVFALGADLEYYRSCLPEDTRYMLCASELIQMSSAA